ncbi:MAG: PKD domain-containing protein, partial [Fibrobacteria bacterium]|nr:PKD domain-containing protein [Fibrobacteria bacterium]
MLTGKIFGNYFVFVIVVFLLISNIQSQILFNEVRPADETSDFCSFVELRNAGISPQTLDGWVIKYTPVNGKQDNGGFLDNFGVTGFYEIPSGILLEPDSVAVFYFGCTGDNSSHIKYVPEKNSIPPFCNLSLYSRTPDETYFGGVWYGTTLHDFIRFGPGKNPPREVISDHDSRNTDLDGNSNLSWIPRSAGTIISDVYVKYNQWSDINAYINTSGLAQDASIVIIGDSNNKPANWRFMGPTPGQPNFSPERSELPPVAPGPMAQSDLPTIPLQDTRHILYASSFNYQLKGDYPRDWHYHQMVSNVNTEDFNTPAKISGTFAINEEYGERGLWISPASINVNNHNMAVAVFGNADWTDYRLHFTVKQTTGDFNRHQLCQFYARLKDDTERVEGYQFNLFGGRSISVRNDVMFGSDFGTVNIHQDVDISGGGELPGVYTQLAKDTREIVNPCNNKVNVTIEVKGDKITSTYDNGVGGKFSLSATDDSYQSGKVGLGLVYGNYIFNNILIEDIKDNPTGNIPVAVVLPIADTQFINTLVTFSAENSIYSGDQSKLSYVWDFGDGYQGSGQRIKHSFAAIGTYRVTCTISDGENQTRDGVFVTVTSYPDSTPPSYVEKLNLSVEDDGILLSWTAATDSQSGISGYTIYREHHYPKLVPTTPLVTIRNVTEFKDISVKGNVTYKYRVKAVNGVKIKSLYYSNSVDTTTSAVGSGYNHGKDKYFYVSKNHLSSHKTIHFSSPLPQVISL